MTEKQERILQEALRLFALNGFASTSTNKVAKAAGVSEGLIFRHFKSKEGLLDAVMDQGSELLKQLFANIVLTSDPKDVIRKTLALPYEVSPADYEYWRLSYALKWQTDRYFDEAFVSLRLVLNNAFEQLGYKDPNAETELVLMLLDGAATALLLHNITDKMDVLAVLKKKYDV